MKIIKKLTKRVLAPVLLLMSVNCGGMKSTLNGDGCEFDINNLKILVETNDSGEFK